MEDKNGISDSTNYSKCYERYRCKEISAPIDSERICVGDRLLFVTLNDAICA